MIRFCVVTCGRNCGPWLENNFKNTAEQNYDRSLVRVCVTDDASTDGSSERIAEACKANNWTHFHNTVRSYALANQYRAIHTLCEDDADVIVFVDLDDWLNGPEVLNTLAKVYDDPDVLLTYGSFITHPERNSRIESAVRPLPADVMLHGGLRRFQPRNGIYWNHLRTFRYGPFREIAESDLQYPHGPKQGQFFHASPDTALMTNMFDLVRTRYRMLPDKLLVYNTTGAEPDWKTHKPQIVEADAIIHAAEVKAPWRPSAQLLETINRTKTPNLPLPSPSPSTPKQVSKVGDRLQKARQDAKTKPMNTQNKSRPISAIYPNGRPQRPR